MTAKLEDAYSDEGLSKAHITLVKIENELRNAGRNDLADGLAIADVVVMNLKIWIGLQSIIKKEKEEKEFDSMKELPEVE
jgi:hypothetical protein